MEGYIVKSVSHINSFKVVNYQPSLDEAQRQKVKISIIKKIQIIFSNGTKSFDTKVN